MYLYFFIFPFALNIDSVCISAKKDSVDCFENNFQIKDERPVFNIKDVVICSFGNGSIPPQAIDLRPAGYAGFYAMPFQISRNLFFKFLNEVRPLRTWTNNAHITFHDIDQLRKFINTEPPKESTESCCSRIVFF